MPHRQKYRKEKIKQNQWVGRLLHKMSATFLWTWMIIPLRIGGLQSRTHMSSHWGYSIHLIKAMNFMVNHGYCLDDHPTIVLGGELPTNPKIGVG